MNIIVI